MSVVDELDKRLIYELRLDSRKSVRELAKSLAESPSTIYNRRKKLEDKEIIKCFSVNLDYEQLSLGKSAYLLIKIDWSSGTTAQKVAEQLKGKKNVFQVTLISGPYDLLVKVRLRTIDDIHKVLTNSIRTVEGIKEIDQFQVFQEVLTEQDILDPFEHDI